MVVFFWKFKHCHKVFTFSNRYCLKVAVIVIQLVFIAFIHDNNNTILSNNNIKRLVKKKIFFKEKGKFMM